MKQFHVYILASKSRVLYIGVTSDLRQRIQQHKNKIFPGFTAKYNVDRLVYVEATNSAKSAIEREKQIKGWLRDKKIALIESINPSWEELLIDDV